MLLCIDKINVKLLEISKTVNDKYVNETGSIIHQLDIKKWALRAYTEEHRLAAITVDFGKEIRNI